LNVQLDNTYLEYVYIIFGIDAIMGVLINEMIISVAYQTIVTHTHTHTHTERETFVFSCSGK